MSEFIHMNHGDDAKRAELMEMLNKSFGFSEGGDMEFNEMLPKLYNEEYKPASNNIVLDVNGEMRAAVGLYYNTFTVCGENLKAGGIGNVACHPDHREKGYMRFCMAYALDEMKQNMTDFAFLSGARQRYARYGFEPVGIKYEFMFNENNVLRKHGKDKKSAFISKKISKNDTDILEKISEIYSKGIFHAQRPAEKIYDIMLSWYNTPYVVSDGENLKGWFALNRERDSVCEIGYADPADIEEIVICALETSGSETIKISVPPFDTGLSKYLGIHCEWYQVGHSEFYNIFCYENVIRAFLKLKSTYQKLQDGECVLLIEGSKLPEQLKISVKDNNVSVEETTEKPDIALTHLEAMRLVGSLYSERRNELKPECASWFPLPFYTYSLDNV